MLKGRTITLYTRTQSGTNDFGEPIYTESSEFVENVLVQPTAADAVVQEQQLYGRHAAYTLCIPKGDTHDWIGAEIVLGDEFGTQKYKQFGDVTVYQEELLPLSWNKQVKIELYE